MPVFKKVLQTAAIQKQNKIEDYSSSGSSSCSSSSSDSDDDISDDEDEGAENYKAGGYHPVYIGETYNKRYKILKKLGWGHFSTVWLAIDGETNKLVALKFQKSAKHYMEAAIDEVKLCDCVNTAAKDSSVDRSKIPIIQLYDHFYHYGPNGKHMVFVFQTLGPSLLEVIKHYRYRGIPIPIVKKLTKDVLRGLAFLHEKCHMIHTDLKPENVLLYYPQPTPEYDDTKKANINWDLICKIYGIDMSIDAPAAPDAKDMEFEESNNMLQSKEDDKEKDKKKNKKKKSNNNNNNGSNRSSSSSRYPTRCPTMILHNFTITPPPNNEPSTTVIDSEVIKPKINIIPISIRWEYPPEQIYMKLYFMIPYHVIDKLLLLTSRNDLEGDGDNMNNNKDEWIFTIEGKSSASNFMIRLEEDHDYPVTPLCEEIITKPIIRTYSLFTLRLNTVYAEEILEYLESIIPQFYFIHCPAFNKDSLPLLNTEKILYRKYMHSCYIPDSKAFDSFDGSLFGLYIPSELPIQFIIPFEERVKFPKDSDKPELMKIEVTNYFENIPVECTVVDLGNACWINKHFSNEIQTRQYRSPEVMIGCHYDTSADIWSCACMIYELLTGDVLFDPKKGSDDERDTDHLAQCHEMIGKIPLKFALSGKRSGILYNRKGLLKMEHERLVYIGIKNKLVEHYEFDPKDAEEIEAFLLPMLTWEPIKRASASEMLKHPWLEGV